MGWLGDWPINVESCDGRFGELFVCVSYLAMPTRHKVGDRYMCLPWGTVTHPCPRRDYAARAVVIALAISPWAFLVDSICSLITWWCSAGWCLVHQQVYNDQQAIGFELLTREASLPSHGSREFATSPRTKQIRNSKPYYLDFGIKSWHPYGTAATTSFIKKTILSHTTNTNNWTRNYPIGNS